MKAHCFLCGKTVSVGSSVCVDCENNKQIETVGYKPGMTVLLSSSTSSRLLTLYRKYFSKPEIEEAYQAYVRSRSLCDEPSQS